MRIMTLLARHGTAKYCDAVPALDVFFALRLPEVARDLLVIDTELPEGHEERLAPGRTLIGAPNTHWEFSAWERGLSYLGARADRYDWIHLATSAFRALGTDHLDRFDVGMLNQVQGRSCAIGHIDCYNEPVVIDDQSLHGWLRSSFIVLPPVELRRLGSLVSIRDPRVFFSGSPVSPFRDDAPVSENCRQYITGWLTGEGTGQGVQWHSRFELSAETLSLFEAKAAAIFNEQLLSARLRAQGCALVDVTWLAGRSPRGAPLGPIPDWRAQIAGRQGESASG